MTELLFPTDAYLKEFDAEVLDVLPEGVLLSRTAFYPGGGGQPHDRGAIDWVDGAANVVSVRKMGDHIVHGIDGPARHGAPRSAEFWTGTADTRSCERTRRCTFCARSSIATSERGSPEATWNR